MKKKLSVVFFSNLYNPVVSGSSTNCEGLAVHLAEMGFNCCVITAKINKNLPDYEILNGVKIYRLGALRIPKLAIALNFPWLSSTFLPQNQCKIKEIFLKEKPDIVHLHNHMFDLSFSAVKWANRHNIPLIITIHTIIKHSNPFYNFLLVPADKFLLKHFVIKKANALICPDRTIERYVKKRFGLTQYNLIPYGIDQYIKPSESMIQHILTKYDLKNKLIILSLGHIHDIRDRHELIEALPLIVKEIKNTILIIVGAEITNATRSQVIRNHMSDRVVFCGPISHDEVPAFLSVASLEAHWLNQEKVELTTLGLAALEAMNAGKVVISTASEDAYGNGILVNGENVCLVEPENPEMLSQLIIELLHDEKRRKRIGQNARRTINKYFSWQTVCNKTIALYQKSIKQKKSDE